MASLKEILRMIVALYPHKGELSNARLTKMVYLVDWLACLRTGHQMTNIKWQYHYYGPFVSDVQKAIELDEALDLVPTVNSAGNPKHLVVQRVQFPLPVLPPSEQAIIDHVIQQTQKLYWDGFIQLVYSTYPILASSKMDLLDLEQLASEYKLLNIAEDTEQERVHE